MKFALIILLVLVCAPVLVGLYYHYKTQHSPSQKQFFSGSIPTEFPEGLYKGMVGGKETAWKGKKFNRSQNSGINIFQQGAVTAELYPFKTFVGSGAVDKQIQTIKIDYNLPENPIWLRRVLDEIVEVSPNHYLGKLEVRITSDFYIALGFFELEKSTE